MRISRDDPANPTMLEAYESVYAYRMEEYIRRQGFTGTGNLAIRREVFDAVGPFGGIGIAEDRDWGQRARAMGHVTRYAPEMRVHHPARPTFADLALKWDRQTAHDFARMAAGRRGAAEMARPDRGGGRIARPRDRPHPALRPRGGPARPRPSPSPGSCASGSTAPGGCSCWGWDPTPRR